MKARFTKSQEALYELIAPEKRGWSLVTAAKEMRITLSVAKARVTNMVKRQPELMWFMTTRPRFTKGQEDIYALISPDGAGWSIEAAAEQLGLPYDTVKHTVSRMIERQPELMKFMERPNIDVLSLKRPHSRETPSNTLETGVVFPYCRDDPDWSDYIDGQTKEVL
jgi:formyltetrahydrofolate hydrolase